MRSIFRILFFLILFNTSVVMAETATSPKTQNEFYIDPEKPEVQTRHFYVEFLNMILTLVVIIILLLLITWAFKRLLHSRMQQINVTSTIKILETRAVSTKASVHLIEVQGKGIVFAESGSGIVKLTEIELPESSFQNILEEKMKK